MYFSKVHSGEISEELTKIMNVREASLDELAKIHNQIGELSAIAGSDYFSERIGANEWLALIAEINGVPVAYKLGYWLAPDIFYSWLGGVLPAYRQQGIAKKLLLEQSECLNLVQKKSA